MKELKKNIKVTPVTVTGKIDQITPISVFEYLNKNNASKKAFLFENNEKNGSAYSFIGINPIETLNVKEGLVSLERENKTVILNGEPAEIIADYLNTYKMVESNEVRGFTGGIIGYIGYDFVRYLESINLPSINTFSENEVCLMLFKDVIVFDHQTNKLTVISNIIKEDYSETDYQKTKLEAEKLYQQVIKSPDLINPEIPTDYQIINDLETSFGEEKFIHAVKKVKEYIKKGDIFQCVLSEKFSFALDTEPFLVYKILRQINPSPYLFYISTGNEVLLGSSPEMLVKTDLKTVQLCAIAGTRPRGIDEIEDKKFEKAMLRSVKEKAEHLMLVDLGRNDIGKVSQPGTVQVKDFMHVEKFSAVMHLVSLIQGKLGKDKTGFDAFKAVFPAGTLSGAPKVRAMQIISELEPVKRGAYGGSVFCYGFSGYLDSCITIRSLFIKDKKAYIQSGAGIVMDSNPNKEYQEIQNKAKAVLKAVSIAKTINKEIIR